MGSVSPSHHWGLRGLLCKSFSPRNSSSLAVLRIPFPLRGPNRQTCHYPSLFVLPCSIFCIFSILGSKILYLILSIHRSTSCLLHFMSISIHTVRNEGMDPWIHKVSIRGQVIPSFPTTCRATHPLPGLQRLLQRLSGARGARGSGALRRALGTGRHEGGDGRLR